MKKIFKIVIPSLISFGFIILSIFIFTYKRPSKITIVNVPYDYTFTSSDESLDLSTILLIDCDDCIYMHKDEIKRSTLSSVDESLVFRADIMSITSNDTTIYEDNLYYLYKINIRIPFDFANFFLLDKVYLNLSYSDDEEISIHLGSLTIYPAINNTDMYYSTLKGLVKMYNDVPLLEGVLVKLYNNSNYVIKSITPLSPFITSNNMYTKEVSYINESNTPITNYIDSKYTPFYTDDTGLNVQMNSEDYLFIALKYDQNISVNTIGFIIEYEKDNVTYQKTINPFRFF